VLAALFLAAAVGAPRAEIIEEVAAYVNGQILTRSDLLGREAQMRAQMSRQFSGEDLDHRLDEARGELLTDMVREVLLLQRAEILGLDLDKVYQSAVENLKQQQGIKTNDEMKDLLKQEGIAQEELRKILLTYNVPDIMVNLEVRQKLVVPEEEIQAYFDNHREDFRVEETYKIREIVLLAEGHTEDELSEISGKIQAALAAGLAFNEAVLKYSEAPSRFQEGIIGPLRAPDMTADLRAAVEKLKEGERAGPIRLRHGIHFVEQVAKTEAKEPELAPVKTGIEAKLKQEKFVEALDAYWQRLYRENRIIIQERYRSYAAGIPAPTGAGG